MIICLIRGDGYPTYHAVPLASLCVYHLMCEFWWHQMISLTARG